MGDRRSGHAVRVLRANQRAKRLPCWLCGQPINYTATDPNQDDAFSYDHALPVATHPHLELDPTNGRSAHQRCNKSRGTKPPAPPIGNLSRRW